jgi:hypothetical protein
MVYLTGFADEAGDDLAGQIRATRELGWSHIDREISGDAISTTFPTRNSRPFARNSMQAVCAHQLFRFSHRQLG